jgi:hypothetical protein
VVGTDEENHTNVDPILMDLQMVRVGDEFF